MTKRILWGLLVLCAPAVAAADDVVAGKTVLSTSYDAKIDAMIVRIDGPAPSIDAMRAEVKAAQAKVTESSGSATRGVVVGYPASGLLAVSRANRAGGGFTTAVGDGATMIEDPADFTLAASPIARTDGFGGGWSQSEKITCSGTLRNTGKVAIDAEVVCDVIGKFQQSKIGELGRGPTLTHTMGTARQSLGKLAPGASKSYAFVVTNLTSPTSARPIAERIGRLDSFLGMTFATKFLVGGVETAHFDPTRATEGKAWLALVVAARAQGLRLDTDSFTRGGSPTFEVDDAFTSLDPAKRKAIALALVGKIGAHYTTYFQGDLYFVYFTKNKRRYAQVENSLYQETP